MSQTRMSHGSSSSLTRVSSQEQSVYWTDDLPVCQLSGVGSSTNQINREDGVRREEHEFEDRSFHFKVEDVYLYGVFDGHDNSKVSNFAMQRIPAELLLGQLHGKHLDDQIKEVLNQAFMSVEKAYFDSIDDALAEKYNLSMDLPEGLNAYETFQQFPDLMKRLQAIEAELSGGTTAVVALIINNRLYVANIGCCRALLCRTDASGGLRVTQLTVDHDLGNEEELDRLAALGIDIGKLQQVGQLGHHGYTRTIGDYSVKGGRNNNEILRMAQSDPVIADPEIQGGIELCESCCFLALMSDGLYKSIEEATGTDMVNSEIASMLVTEFSQQSTLNGVAQAVVDKVVRKHHDTYMTSTDHRKQLCQKRDDIMLLVRNFNYPLPNAINSPTCGELFPIPVTTSSLSTPLSVIIPSPVNSPSKSPPPVLGTRTPMFFVAGSAFHTNQTNHSTMSNRTATQSSTYTSSTNESTQSDDGHKHFVQQARVKTNPLVLDENGRITAYVNFDEFYSAINEMSDCARENFHAEMEPKPAYEAIPEEAGSPQDGTDQISGATDRFIPGEK